MQWVMTLRLIDLVITWQGILKETFSKCEEISMVPNALAVCWSIRKTCNDRIFEDKEAVITF